MHPPIVPDLSTIKIAGSPSRACYFSCRFYPLSLEKTQIYTQSSVCHQPRRRNKFAGLGPSGQGLFIRIGNSPEIGKRLMR